MTEDGYPDEQELEYIKNFDILHHDPMDLVLYVQKLWLYNDSVTIERVKGEWSDRYHHKVSMATTGWSGNESLIQAMKENEYFFLLYHSEWHRGGLWIFEIPIGSKS